MTKREAYRKSLIEQRDRLEQEAYEWQKTVDVRELGPLIEAYAVILKFLDYRIACLPT